MEQINPLHSLASTFGELMKSKTVGFFAGFCLLFNQMTGPGVPFTPANFQSPGWLFTCLCYFIFCITSGFSMLFLIESMQAIPGNAHFQGNVEFSTLINFYFGSNAHLAGQIVLCGALQSISIQAIILISQSLDTFFVDVAGGTCGLSMTFRWICVHTHSMESSEFGDTFMWFTLGFLLTLLLILPLSALKMDGSVTVTVISCIISIFMSVQWIASACLVGLNPSRVPTFETSKVINYGNVMGTVMLNLACCTVIPSWINVKAKEVRAQDVIWFSIFFTSFYYIVVGVFLALGFDISSVNPNVLTAVFQFGIPSWLSKFTVGMFSIVMLLPGIPVNFIVSKNNLVQNKVVSEKIATFISFCLPCILSIPILQGSLVRPFQTWTSLIFISSCNFILPFMLYFKCIQFRKDFNRYRILTKHQLNLLFEIHSNSSEIRNYITRKEDGGHNDVYQLTVRNPNFPNFPCKPYQIQPPEDNASEAAVINTQCINVYPPEDEGNIMIPLKIEIDSPNTDSPWLVIENSEANRNSPYSSNNNGLLSVTKPIIRSETPSSAFSGISRLETLNDRNFLTLRTPRNKSPAEQHSNAMFLDPAQTPLTIMINQDVPDPDPFTPQSSTDELDDVPEVEQENLIPESRLSLPARHAARHSADSVRSLPRHPAFRTPPFESVPKWTNIKPVRVATIVMYLVITFSFANIIFNIVLSALDLTA